MVFFIIGGLTDERKETDSIEKRCFNASKSKHELD